MPFSTKYPTVSSARVEMFLLTFCTIAKHPRYQCSTPCHSASLPGRNFANSSTKVFFLSSQSKLISALWLAILYKQSLLADIRDIYQFKNYTRFVYNWSFYLRQMRNIVNAWTLRISHPVRHFLCFQML